MYNKLQKTNDKLQSSKKIFDIGERTYIFAKTILDIAEQIPSGTVLDVIRKQLVRSGTSIGANIKEAEGALTKPDRKNRIIIARKETFETCYWLTLISDRYFSRPIVKDAMSECKEFIKIFTVMSKKISL